MASLFGGAFGASAKGGNDLFSRSEAFRRAGDEEKVIQPEELAPALKRKKKEKFDVKKHEEEEEKLEEVLTASAPRAPLPFAPRSLSRETYPDGTLSA